MEWKGELCSQSYSLVLVSYASAICMYFSDQGPPSSLRVSSSNGEESSVTLGESETSLSTVGERSFLILNDSGDSQCQVEVEVLQEDSSSILEGIPISPADNLVTQVN